MATRQSNQHYYQNQYTKTSQQANNHNKHQLGNKTIKQVTRTTQANQTTYTKASKQTNIPKNNKPKT